MIGNINFEQEIAIKKDIDEDTVDKHFGYKHVFHPRGVGEGFFKIFMTGECGPNLEPHFSYGQAQKPCLFI